MARYDVWHVETDDGLSHDVLIVDDAHWESALSHATARVRAHPGETVYVSYAGSTDLESVVAYLYVDDETGSLTKEEA